MSFSDFIGAIDASEFTKNSLIIIAALAMSTFIHELGHWIVSAAYGCPASILHVGLVTGLTEVSPSCPGAAVKYIALAGPLMAFAAGIFVYATETGKFRILTVPLLLTSSAIQLIPVKPADGFVAVQYGLPVITEIILFVSVLTIAGNLLIRMYEK